jgi:dipeptidyl-peptidase-4
MKYRTVLTLVICLFALQFAAADEFVKTKPTGPFTLDRLYQRPYMWGSPPQAIKWSGDGRLLAYLWTPPGEEASDLFIEHVGEARRTRLSQSRASAGIEEADRKAPREYLFTPSGGQIVLLAGSGLYVLPSALDGRARLLLRAENLNDLQAPASGKEVSVIRDGNLWAVDLESGAARRLTWLPDEPADPSYPRLRTWTRIQQYGWSPTGGQIYVLEITTEDFRPIAIPDYTGARDVEPIRWLRGFVGKPIMHAQVGVVNTAAGGIRWISFPGDYYYNSETAMNGGISWSPDGSKLMVNAIAPDYQDWTIYLVDSRTLAPTSVYTEHQEPWFRSTTTYWSPDGGAIYLTSERSGWQHIYRLPAGGGEPQQLTNGGFDVFSLEPPTPAGRIYFTSGQVHPLESHLYYLDAEGKAIQLSTQAGEYTPFPSPGGKRVAVLYSSVTEPHDLYLMNVDNPGNMRRLSTSPHADFAKVVKPEVRYFTFPNKEDGRLIRGYMLLPPGFDARKRYPVVLSCVYADIAKNRWIRYNLLDFFMCAEMRYIVARIDLRASIGYGKAFHYGYYQKMGIVDAGECAGAADFFRSQPYVDPNRVGIWGSSYGGFLTLMVMCTKPGAFAVGVALKPVTDWENYTDDYTAQRLGRPDKYPEVYRAASPRYHAGGLSAPLLILHGMMDDNVLFQDTALMVQAFIEAGKKVDVMFYPREDHSFSRHPDSLRDIMKRTAAFFERHLGVGPN